MKLGKILFFLAFLLMISGLNGCSSGKDISARRNLMMPNKSDLPRNSKYNESKRKKTYKPNKKKKKRKSKSLTYHFNQGICENLRA